MSADYGSGSANKITDAAYTDLPPEVAEISTNEPNSPQARLAILDEALVPLLEPLVQCGRSGWIVAFSAWRLIPEVNYLPFHLHLHWPDRIHWLPLNASVTFLPELDIDDQPLYEVNQSRAARREARFTRYQEQRALPLDLEHPDWEDGAARHDARIGDESLSPWSFLSVDQIRANGAVVRGHRPVLGRFASRTDPRPSVLVPTRRRLDGAAIQRLAETDLLIANVQNLRGLRSIRVVTSVTGARQKSKPTLIVASSPSDLYALGIHEEQLVLPVLPVSPPPQTVSADLTLVGLDRPSAEERFRFAVSELAGTSTSVDRVLELAKRAWWVARQSFSEGIDIEVRRFSEALESLLVESPFEAGALTACRDVVLGAANDLQLALERRRTIVDLTFHLRDAKDIVMITRSPATAAELRAMLAVELGVDVPQLGELGVSVRTNRDGYFSAPPDVAIIIGYFGLNTLDVIFRSQAQHIEFIMDPIETRAMWFGAKQMVEFLESRQLAGYAAPLKSLMSSIEKYVPAFADIVEMDIMLTTNAVSQQLDSSKYPSSVRLGGSEMAIYFTDGTVLDVTRNARFEILGKAGGHTKVVPADQLHIGDHVVVIDGMSHGLFSEQRIAALDDGPLRPLARSRKEWLTIVQGVYSARRPNLRELARTMVDAGEPVDYGTVRSWVTFSDPSDARTPMRWSRFKAFARIFGVALPDSVLREYFSNIKRWRVLHRKAGRDLARAIRAAYANRIGAVTLARIEREWGMTARQLITAARMLTVDDIVSNEGETGDTD